MLKKITALAALAFAAAPALALPPGDFVPGTTLEVVISGASAQDNALNLAMINDLCVGGTLDFYTEVGGGGFPADFNAYFCTLDAGITGLAADTDAVIYKRSSGGSGQGPIGVCQGGLDSLDISAGCALVGPNGVGDLYECPNLVQRTSDAGFSDLEIDRLPLGNGGDACDNTPVVTNTLYGTIFNVPVTTELRNALQLATGLTVGAEDEANMPSLTKQQIAALFSGGIPDWGSLLFPVDDDANPATPDVALSLLALVDDADVDPADLVSPSTDPNSVLPFVAPRVHVCRRTLSSGTGTQYAVKFHNTGCTTGSIDPQLDNTPASSTSTNTVANFQLTAGSNPFGPVISETSSSSRMTTCLNAQAAAGTWAIGIQSLEKNPDLGDDFRFIKVDGAAPTVENVLLNKYFDWVESVMIWRTDASGDVLTVMQALAAQAGSNTNIVDLNEEFVQPFGQSGYVSLNTIPGNVPSTALPLDVVNNPVATSTHFFGGASNSCRTPFVNVDSIAH